MGKLSYFLHLFTYLIIYLGQYAAMDTYFTLWVIIKYCFIYFVAQSFPVLAIGNSFSWLLWPFDRLLPCGSGLKKKILFDLFLTFWQNKMLQAHLVYSLLQSISPARPLFLLENGVKNKIRVPGVLLVPGVLISKSTQLTQQGNTCMWTNPCIDTYLQIFLYICIKLIMGSYRCLQL